MEIRRDHLEPEFFYHIYNRGINSEDVYKNKDNYLYFLKKAKEFLLPVADIYAYCLMKNHFHLQLHHYLQQMNLHWTMQVH